MKKHATANAGNAMENPERVNAIDIEKSPVSRPAEQAGDGQKGSGIYFGNSPELSDARGIVGSFVPPSGFKNDMRACNSPCRNQPYANRGLFTVQVLGNVGPLLCVPLAGTPWLLLGWASP